MDRPIGKRCEMENKSVHQRRFEAAVKVMRTLPADGAFVPSDDMLMRFSTYHIQATVGSCDPCSRDTLSEAKWEAWKALGDMSKEDAMKAYVEEILLILEMIPVTEEVSDLLDVLEPFYEVVEDDKDEDDETASQPETSTSSGSSDEWTGSSAGDVDDDSEDSSHASEPEQSCDESVGDVWSDSVRAKEGSGGLRAAAARAKRPEGRLRNTKDEGGSQDGNPQGAAALPPFCKEAHGPVQSVILSAGKGRGCKLSGESVTRLSDVETLVDDREAGQGTVTEPLKAQIVVVLSRLQEDMRSALERLNTLEARAVSQVERLALRCAPHRAHTEKHLFICPSAISQISVAFLFAWPFVTHYLVQLYLQKKSERRREVYTRVCVSQLNKAAFSLSGRQSCSSLNDVDQQN
ncbi:acyl-CoA-binding domain-containing protein 5-B isoform X2 [Tachysurus fulvidraco]|uniref:acyl-CoA-binding domain-containing protein 5-B isoform X2 n=1 Tax=Tachysurus fulvidraco TaxID=1234273 RepID=UPI001FED5329|nr:acyl-CoA-binding domain-containing protein 5-B isoform X2 [Tachysurus fulvidraco]